MAAATGLPHRRMFPRSRPSPSSSVAPPQSAMSAAVADFPSWVLLEPFVRRDDKGSFPDESKAPIRASGTTSWGADFSIAFSLAEPPRISRLYAKLPRRGFRDPGLGVPLSIVATHRHLALLRVETQTRELLSYQNFFIHNAKIPSPSSLQMLPPCTEPDFNYTHDDGSLSPTRTPSDTRLLDVKSMGFWCGGEVFVVAELSLYKPISCSKVFADIYLLRSSMLSYSLRSCGDGKWSSMRVEIMSTSNPDDEDLWRLCCWQTETVVPFQRWLCWIDYCNGILFFDMEAANPTVSFLRFPPGMSLHTSTATATATATATGSGSGSDSDSDSDAESDTDTDMCGFLYCGASVVDHGRALKFVNVIRHDGIPFGALKPGSGFAITCHTLMLGDGSISSMAWEKDYTVTSMELWDTNKDNSLPHGILMFPRVDIDRPHVVHFLFIEFGFVKKKMWTVSIDMNTRLMESLLKYIDGWEDLESDNADLITYNTMSPKPFLPCEFPRFCSRRKRKGMD
ncbi:unnamed protein product [Urochloa decumbens]|uniref:DUF1618 domain-containing protein n=1 Tax=Urochloa decumbens TaxID=240449 RepID=A0ABC9GYL1_9POAL